jgi:hypothetical protein
VSSLGASATGRLALGQIGQTYGNASVTLSQAAATGVAGALTPNVSKTLTGVAGTGTAGQIASSVATTLTGVAGVGVANPISKEIDKFLIGVSGTGTAGLLAPFLSITLTGVQSAGVAHALTPSVATGSLGGVAGIGVAGQITANTGGNLLGVAGIGIAGIITVQISGGGGGRRKKALPGFDSIRKEYASAKLEAEPKLKPPAPQFIRKSPPTAPSLPEPPQPDISTLTPVLTVERQIEEGMRATGHIHDAQDAEDIAELLAFLDTEEMA